MKQTPTLYKADGTTTLIWNLAAYDPYNTLGERVISDTRKTKEIKYARSGFTVYAWIAPLSVPALARRQAS